MSYSILDFGKSYGGLPGIFGAVQSIFNFASGVIDSERLGVAEAGSGRGSKGEPVPYGARRARDRRPPCAGRRKHECRKCEEANKIIARLNDQKHVFFTNINSKFLDEKGGLIGFRPSDNLHPVEEGYEIWASSVAPTLKSWIR